ncbi:MAG TPA: C10 family peptidase [Lentimicrobium sp.]|nr:C10 family peptidase [Lentimicrobium sp.]
MKAKLILIALISFALNLSRSYCQENQLLTSDEAYVIAKGHMALFSSADLELLSPQEICDDLSHPLAWVFKLEPQGFIVVPATQLVPKVIAYSFNNDFGDLNNQNPLLRILRSDISQRIRYYKQTDDTKTQILNHHTRKIENKDLKSHLLLDQWPATGDGWLTTNWTQTTPYNDLCPMDPVTLSRSYAGCPSVAMAMILNFHRETNGTHFDDSDDYYHNYAGRQYWIDDDYQQVDFASFTQLNEYLDTLNAHWTKNQPLTSTDKASLTFACGVACKQVYSSEGSGTFGVNQALDAYLRFGCTTAELLDESDPGMWDRLKQNIKDTLPAHLAVVDEAWQTGHNVVVDGYNTEDYYHINFGWGGPYNSWYLLPEEMPYNLTVVEGVVLDIMKDTTVNVKNYLLQTCKVYPNPSGLSTHFLFANPGNVAHSIIIYNTSGQVLETIDNIRGNEVIFTNTSRNSGLYFFRLQNNNGVITAGKFVIH